MNLLSLTKNRSGRIYWLLGASLSVVLAISAEAQSPASIGGRTIRLNAVTGTGAFASSGSFRFLPSATDSAYAIVPLVETVAPSIGTHAYSKSGPNTGKLSLMDDSFGPATANCTFITQNSGNYSLVSGLGGGSQSGTFVMHSGTSPASISGSTITVSITSGDGVIFGSSGGYEFRPAATGSDYSITGLFGIVSNSTGTYAYVKNSEYTARLAFTDSIAGTGFTSQLSYETPTTGTVFLRNATGTGYQTGIFTTTVPAPPPLVLWRQTQFGPNATNEFFSGDLSNPDGDGLVNLLEYALGGDPNRAASAPSPDIVVVDNRISLNFTRMVAATDVSLTVQGADSANGPWTDIARSVGGNAVLSLDARALVTETTSGETRLVQVRDVVTIGQGSRYLRLKVSH